MIKDCDILCLDEATSNIDPETGIYIYKNMYIYTYM